MEVKGEKTRWPGLSGSTLKLIAIISMLIDHTGAVLLNGSQAYTLCRFIGRIAFPIFCFLLVEGYCHTHDIKRYAGRLFLFALISEIPFDLAFSRTPVNFYYQNVFFTLWIGIGVMYAMDRMGSPVLKLFAVVAGMAAAGILRTDYSWMGIAAIAVLYYTRESRLRQVFCGALMFLWELPAVGGFLPIYFYNGKRGVSIKYLFYVFYPAHLLVLVWLRTITGGLT